jgi:hypothetical protein
VPEEPDLPDDRDELLYHKCINTEGKTTHLFADLGDGCAIDAPRRLGGWATIFAGLTCDAEFREFW